MNFFKPSTWPALWRSKDNADNPPMTESQLLDTLRGWSDQQPTKAEAMRGLMEFSRLVRSYEASTTTEYNADLKGTLGSANSEIFPGLFKARANTRTLAKDTAQGKVVQRTYQNNVVGERLFKLDMRVGKFVQKPNETTGKTEKVFQEEEETNDGIQSFWKWYCRQENFTIRKTWSGMEAGRMVEASQIRDGSVICRMYDEVPNEIGFAVDFLEADRLQEMYSGTGKNGNPIRASIEYDKKWGFPVAYHILVRHPGDSLFGQQNYPLGEPQSGAINFREEVPAEDIIHINNLRDRAEQDVGMTEFDAAVQPIWRNTQFTKALTLCAIASHIRAFILEKKFPTGMEIPHEMRETIENAMLNFASGGAYGGAAGANPVAAQQGSGRPIDTLRPGQERELPYGVEAKMLAPPFPTEQSHEFRLDNHREVAIATGISYQHASGDYQNLGFIAGLMCQIPFQDWCKIRQTHLIECWISRLFKRALRAGIMSGWFDKRGFTKVTFSRLEEFCDAANFKGKRWAFVNPLVQAQYLILLMEAQIMSPQQVQDELPDGVSIEDLYAMIADAKAEAEKHGVGIGDVDVTRPTMPKGEPGQTDPAPSAIDSAQPPPKSKVANPVRFHNRLKVPMETLLSMSTNGEH